MFLDCQETMIIFGHAWNFLGLGQYPNCFVENHKNNNSLVWI